jgi:hypothetical protein
MQNAISPRNRIGRLLASVAAISAACLSTPAPAAAQETIRQYLSGRDGEHTVPWEFLCTEGRNSGFWTDIAVPSCWETQGFGKFRYGTEDRNYQPIEAQYRHRFTVPADWRGKSVFLVFEGVMTDAAVKINGQEAGPLHQGAFYRFKFDVTSRLQYGAENVVEVTVHDKSADTSVNRAEREGDYWTFGGIFRPVWLDAVPTQFLDHVAIDARSDGAFAMNYVLGGEGSADAVEVSILDAKGETAAQPISVPVAAGTVDTQVPAPMLWTAETPSLYTAVVRLKQGEKVLHEIKQRFGFRTIEVRDGDGIYVNGQRVLLRGICHHVAWPTLGRSSSERIARLDVGLIQEMNMDAARMSHYPPDEEFLDACDEMGVYVLDELAGWQHKYDTDIGRARLKDMIMRDVNHPSIIMWDNANEGGWNTALDGDYAQLDIQRRVVDHPGGGKFGDILDNHYPTYNAFTNSLAGRNIVLPTEILHGLFDGGAGSGLDDYWNAMRASKTSAGSFIWVFADEGVKRIDTDGSIDVKGNQAPDGVMGPYREKEGSFFTIRQVYSPVQLPSVLPPNFDGTLPVENRYEFLNLSKCSFTWALRRFEPMSGGSAPAPGSLIAANGSIPGPDVAAGGSGTIKVALPADWLNRNAEALEVKALNPAGHELWTWVWPIAANAKFAPAGQPRAGTASGTSTVLADSHVKATIATDLGSLTAVTVDGQKFSLTSGPIAQARWNMLDSGWLKLEYAVDPVAQSNLVGVAFDYPEEKMVKKSWLGDGPYRVWRNRLKGTTLGVWETAYNTTMAGYKDWVFPEFAGYFANVRWLRLTTTEGILTLMIPDEHTFVRVGTPKAPPNNLAMRTSMTFPVGNLAILRDIPPMGSKFQPASNSGPQANTPLAHEPYQGTVYLRFEPASADKK